jgi:hypothetical protein
MREYPRDLSLELHRRLKPELGRLLDANAPAWGIVVSSWYPDELPNTMLEVLRDLLGDREHARALREGTRYAMDKTFGGIYRPVARLFISPERISKHIQALWQMNHDSGQVTWQFVRPGLIRTELRGWNGHHEHRCEINRLMEEFLLGSLGCKDVLALRKTCVGRGAAACSSEVTWRP